MHQVVTGAVALPPTWAAWPRVTSVRCIPNLWFSPCSRGVHQPQRLPSYSPSVASVTSVRCIPNLWFSPCSRGVHQRQRLPSYSPLCGLRDLCAMHSQFCGSRPAVAGVHQPVTGVLGSAEHLSRDEPSFAEVHKGLDNGGRLGERRDEECRADAPIRDIQPGDCRQNGCSDQRCDDTHNAADRVQ